MARGIYHGPFWHGVGLGSKGECPSCHLKYSPACRMSRSKRGCPLQCKANKRAGRLEIGRSCRGPRALLQELPTAAERREVWAPKWMCSTQGKGQSSNPGNHSPWQVTRKVLGSSRKFKVPPLLIPWSFISQKHWLVLMQVHTTGLQTMCYCKARLY